LGVRSQTWSSKSSSMSHYYEILGLGDRVFDSALSEQDVKLAYRRALLEHHPDKITRAAASSKPAVTVDDIALAYRTLADPEVRAEYDRSLLQSAPNGAKQDRVLRTGLETVDLDSLAFEDNVQAWSRSCRCGDTKGFVITETELEKHIEDGELTVGCKGCSLWLRVLFSVEN